MQTTLTQAEVATGSNASAVSWAAIFAGAAVAAAISLVLFALGSGLGLATGRLWSHAPHPGVTFTATAAAWLIIMQWLSSGLGGYITGRLRTKWVNLHTDEVFFRDTAHGFLAWAVASVAMAALFASGASSVIGGGAHNMAVMEAGHPGPAAGHGPLPDPNAYYVDALLRSGHAPATEATPEVHGEISRMLMNGIRKGEVPPADKAYLTELVSNYAGIAQPEATHRVENVTTQMSDDNIKMKEVADTARKTAATLSVITALSLIVGAFIASVSGALGGKRRDEY